MRTMFPTQEKTTKKKFQKPNILRKRSKKPVKLILDEAFESPDKNSLVNKICTTFENEVQLDAVETPYSIPESDLDPTVEPVIEELNHEQPVMGDLEVLGSGASANDDTVLEFNGNESTDQVTIQMSNEELRSEDTTSNALVNVESFFNESGGEEYMLFDIDFDSGKPIETLVVIDNESPESEMYIEENPDVITSMVPLAAVTAQPLDTNEEVATSPNFLNFSPMVKFKCDVPNCGKEFRSEQKYKKHKNTHEQDGSIRAPRQVTVECPVKKIEEDGTESGCGKIFLIREQLMKHLNDEHTLEEAVYRCEECGRRFFWASGLRAHVRAHCRRAAGAGASAEAGAGAGAGAGLVCSWPGCGRVFRQPCRLREHARAHNGDRPYPCQYPNCGWSFRSASKLMRHARRHTGERRHACAACGRAFLRREHLRDHDARHHAPQPRRPVPCTQPGCEQTFSNMSTLYLHMKKVHKSKEAEQVEAPAAAGTETVYTVPDNMFMVSLAPEPEESEQPEQPEQPSVAAAAPERAASAEPEERAGEGRAEEWRAARTHCTWPLERAPAAALRKDDWQIEQSEASETNTFTVRSDLFLHGNVLINEDSEHMGVGGAGDSLAADLGLLDAHPTIDLMQEELMYADTAADESSFRIFLLSGEELT